MGVLMGTRGQGLLDAGAAVVVFGLSFVEPARSGGPRSDSGAFPQVQHRVGVFRLQQHGDVGALGHGELVVAGLASLSRRRFAVVAPLPATGLLSALIAAASQPLGPAHRFSPRR